MTLTGLRGLKKLTPAIVAGMNIRHGYFRPLVVDNKRWFDRPFLTELDDLTVELARVFGGDFHYDERSWHVYDHHLACWPVGYSSKLQPNLAFTWDPSYPFGMRVGFGLNVNLYVDGNSPIYLSVLHNKANACPSAFNALARDFGASYIESPFPNFDGVRAPFMKAVTPPNYPGDVLGWWFYGRDLYLRTDWLVISNNATIAALQAKVIAAVRERGFWN